MNGDTLITVQILLLLKYLKNEQLQYNVTVFVTTGTIRVQGTCYMQFIEVLVPKLANILQMVLANMSQSAIQNNNTYIKCPDDNLVLEPVEVSNLCWNNRWMYAYNAHKIRHRKVWNKYCRDSYKNEHSHNTHYTEIENAIKWGCEVVKHWQIQTRGHWCIISQYED